jgi:hypothetical protein
VGRDGQKRKFVVWNGTSISELGDVRAFLSCDVGMVTVLDRGDRITAI